MTSDESSLVRRLIVSVIVIRTVKIVQAIGACYFLMCSGLKVGQTVIV